MKFSLPLIQLIIRLLILAILFVVLFMLSLTLYSTKFWPDVHRYINANITIKRIPKLSEIDYEILDRVTESIDDGYTTTEFYDASTIVFEGDDFSLDDIDFERKKRSVDVGKDYSEVPRTVVVDYFFDLGDGVWVRDLVHDSELTTRVDDVEMLAGVYGMKERSMETEAVDKELATSVFPWIATIFVKNDTSNQFNYYCDGALLSNVAVITAARCVQTSNMTMNNDDVLVFLGKKSLTVMTGAERVVRIKEVKVHENFTASSGNDLAMLIFEERVIFSDSIQPASLSNEDAPAEYIATTGWQTTGDLTPILLKTDEDGRCGLETEADDTFCSVYGNDVTVCPSYGGLYVTKQASWSLQGLRTDDPEDRGLCFKRNIAFTSFKKHANWIQENLQ